MRAVVQRGSPLSLQPCALSQLFYYPHGSLAVGIFVGAVWANVSWGTYWSWDAKEVWALITFMVYAAAAHGTSLPMMRRPMPWHVFMVAALPQY